MAKKPHIKMKAQSPCNVVTMPNRRDVCGSDTKRRLRETADYFADTFPQMAGYVVVSWDANGTTLTEVRNTKTSPIERLVIPHYVTEAVRERILEISQK